MASIGIGRLPGRNSIGESSLARDTRRVIIGMDGIWPRWGGITRRSPSWKKRRTWIRCRSFISADLAEELLIAHRYDEATKQIRKTMNMDPFFALAHYVLGEVFVQKHVNTEAIAELQKAIELSPGSSAFTANLAYAYAVSGKKDQALKILNDLKSRSQASSNFPEIALVYVGLDERDQAIAWLEKAYAERFNP